MRLSPVSILPIVILLGSTSAMTSPYRPLPDEANSPASGGEQLAKDGEGDGGARSLPYARGRAFADLDSYLAFRRQQAAIDLPWYEEVSPGLYELRTSMRPSQPTRQFTRMELARKFGFSR